MHRFGKLLVVVALVATSFASLGALPPRAAGAAGTGSVVINELHYHPADNDEREEFVELTNAGTTTVDLSGWCLADGITGCFGAGTTIAPGAFAVASPNAARFTAVYGGSATTVYAGSMNNSGERISLVDSTGATVDTVAYGDADPWPTKADGEGPSLERIDPAQSGDTPRNWRASTAASGTTIRAVNTAPGPGWYRSSPRSRTPSCPR